MISVKRIAQENDILHPVSLKDHIMTIEGNDYNSVRKQITWLINTNHVFTFSSSDIKVKVPARSPIGIPPRRTANIIMQASSDYMHSSPFYQHVYYHSNGLTDTKTIEDTAINGPGLNYQWNLKNKTTFPVNGRTAEMKVNLLVKRKPDYEISTPRFSSVYSAVRDRFFDHFFHNGLIAQNYWPVQNKLKFADQPLYMGQALIMLSSEIDIWRLRQEMSGGK